MSISEKFTALFRGPFGQMVPASVDDAGRLNASIGPYANPDNAIQENSTPAVNTIASITLPAVANRRHIITALHASTGQVSNQPNPWFVQLTGSSSGLMWGAYCYIYLGISQQVGFTNNYIASAVNESVTLEFVSIGSAVNDFYQTLTLTGFELDV